MRRSLNHLRLSETGVNAEFCRKWNLLVGEMERNQLTVSPPLLLRDDLQSGGRHLALKPRHSLDAALDLTSIPRHSFEVLIGPGNEFFSGKLVVGTISGHLGGQYMDRVNYQTDITNVYKGIGADNLKIRFVSDTSAGNESAEINQETITVHIGSGSTIAQCRDAINALDGDGGPTEVSSIVYAAVKSGQDPGTAASDVSLTALNESVVHVMSGAAQSNPYVNKPTGAVSAIWTSAPVGKLEPNEVYAVHVRLNIFDTEIEPGVVDAVDVIMENTSVIPAIVDGAFFNVFHLATVTRAVVISPPAELYQLWVYFRSDLVARRVAPGQVYMTWKRTNGADNYHICQYGFYHRPVYQTTGDNNIYVATKRDTWVSGAVKYYWYDVSNDTVYQFSNTAPIAANGYIEFGRLLSWTDPWSGDGVTFFVINTGDAFYHNPPAGLNVTVITAPVTPLGLPGFMTFTKGILTAQLQAT